MNARQISSKIVFALSLIFLINIGSITHAKPLAVASTGMIADLVNNIAGDRIEVRQLIGSGVDPHLYKLSRSDVATLTKADIIFYTGLLLEGKMIDAISRLQNSGKQVYAVAELVSKDLLLQPEGFEGNYDPHLWMDPVAWQKVAAVITEKLIHFDPTGKLTYENNNLKLQQQLTELHSYSEKALNSIPPQSRVLISAHDAFNYFGKRYNFEVLGIQGISTESEAGVKDIENLISRLVQSKIKAVFVESTVSDRSIKALVEGARAKGHDVSAGGSLFSDAMGVPGTYEGSYIGMIDHNVTTITRALGGQAPAQGMNSKLEIK
jgi:manganese/zinc/iron transport system substrate-binding protein